MLEGILASVGSVGDAYDNALAESTIGLFKTEAMAKNNPFHHGPFKTIADVEYTTAGSTPQSGTSHQPNLKSTTTLQP